MKKVFSDTGGEFICQLPASSSEWRMITFIGQDGMRRVVVINQENPPYIIEDGIATILVSDALQTR